MLRNLSPEQLDAIEQELLIAQANGGNFPGMNSAGGMDSSNPAGRSLLPASGGLSSRIGRGILSGAQAAGESVVRDVREMAGFKDPNQDMKEFLMKEKIKQQLGEQDPYKKSQLAINQKILANLEGSEVGGDLVYREQNTGTEVPVEEALPRIQKGEQFIIKRRVATRQGVKEEPVSEPKPITEGEVKTSTGAEQVLSEIDQLEKIIQSEPTDRGSSVPFIGKSAQAQGVKIPFVAPYGVSEKGQQYRTLRESINNRLLYLRSGAQINDKEYQRLSGMLPELFRTDKVDLEQLQRFKSEFSSILNRIQSGRRGLGTTNTQPSTGDNLSNLKSKYGLD